jgi:hypothetical protein
MSAQETTTKPQTENPASVEPGACKKPVKARNPCGPDHSLAREVTQLKRTLVNFANHDDMEHVALCLKEEAMGGDLAAIKLLFLYLLGEPTETVDPDGVNMEECPKPQEKSGPPDQGAKAASGSAAPKLCKVTSVAWPDVVEHAYEHSRLPELQQKVERDGNRRGSKARRWPSAGLRSEGRPPSPNRDNGLFRDAGPTTNGPIQDSWGQREQQVLNPEPVAVSNREIAWKPP